MRTRTLSILSLAAMLAMSCAAAADDVVSSPAVKIWNPGGAVTEGEVTVPGTPAEIYAAVTDYARWPAIFSNLRTSTVKSGDAVAATVETVSTKGKRHTLVFKNDPLALVVRFEERGGRAEARAEITFRSARRAGFTVVRARLYADVHGAAGLFVRDSTIRSKREHKVMGDLSRLHAYFTTPQPPR
jgi:uncharacterized membrane protein